jgi:hypothetical protein
MSYRKQPEQTQVKAGAKAGFSELTARRIESDQHQTQPLPRHYKTTKDHFNGLFEEHLVPLLKLNPVLQSITLLDEKAPN